MTEGLILVDLCMVDVLELTNIDADTLDSIDSSQFLRSDTD